MKPKVIEVAPATIHQVLDEISRNSCQNKEKEEHSKYDDYDKYYNNRFNIQHIIEQIESAITKTCLLIESS